MLHHKRHVKCNFKNKFIVFCRNIEIIVDFKIFYLFKLLYIRFWSFFLVLLLLFTLYIHWHKHINYIYIIWQITNLICKFLVIHFYVTFSDSFCPSKLHCLSSVQICFRLLVIYMLISKEYNIFSFDLWPQCNRTTTRIFLRQNFCRLTTSTATITKKEKKNNIDIIF